MYTIAIFLWWIVIRCSAAGMSPLILFDPPTEVYVFERHTETINLTVWSNSTTSLAPIYANLSILDDGVAALGNRTIDFDFGGEAWESSFDVTGVFVGRTFVNITIVDKESQKPLQSYKYGIAVLRTNSIVQTLFSLLVTCMVSITTFMMGTQLDWAIIKRVLRRPVAPVVGLSCQFILMPLISFMWGQILLSGMQILQLGYFAVGCSPGGGGSNFWSILLDGNLDLSVTMTFCSNILALAMMPFWLKTLGEMVIVKGTKIQIPFQNLAISLLMLIIPTLIGILVKRYRPKWAEFATKYIKYVTITFLMVLLPFGIYANLYVFQLFTWKICVAGFLLPYTGFAIAFIVAYLCRQDLRNRKTIAIETGIQNGGIALVLLNFTLQRPDSDLGVAMPVASVLFTPLPLFGLLLVIVIRRWWNHRRGISDGKPESTQQAGQSTLDKDTEMEEKEPFTSGKADALNVSDVNVSS